MNVKQDFQVEITRQMLDAYPVKKYEEKEIPVRSGNVKVYLYNPDREADQLPVVFYLHGGGFVKGHHIRDNYFCQKICYHVGALVIDIDYSTAPEHPFPCALYEGYDTVAYFMAQAEQYRINKDAVYLMGNSAGGNLAAGITRLSIEQKAPFRIRKLVLDWAPMDLFTPHREKASEWNEQMEKTAERGAYYNECYAKGEDLKNPLISPLYTEMEILEQFPETFIMAAGLDLLCQESLDFGEKLRNCKADVTVKKMEECHHGFITNLKDNWEAGEQLIFRFLKGTDSQDGAEK